MVDPIVESASRNEILASLASDALIAELRRLSGEERRVQVAFLLHLEEFDRRRAYLDAGHGSLWDWCVRELHLSEGAAGRRIGAMKVVRRFPVIADAIRDGRLSLSTATLLGHVLTDDNFEEVVGRAAYKSRAEVDYLVASIRPREAARDGIRKLPTATRPDPVPARVSDPSPLFVATRPAAAVAPPQERPTPEREECDRSAMPVVAPPDAPRAERGSGEPETELDRAPPRRAEVRPISEDRWSVHVTLDSASRADLELLRDLLSHKCGRDLAAVLSEAIRCGVEKHGKRRGAVATRHRRATHEGGRHGEKGAGGAPRRFEKTDPPGPGSGSDGELTGAEGAAIADRRLEEKRANACRDPIPVAVKQAVYDRDGGCCAFVAADGKRCGSKWKLEFDHLHSAFLGSPSTVDNVRLLCRSHNVHHAEEVFGREHMEHYRRRE